MRHLLGWHMDGFQSAWGNKCGVQINSPCRSQILGNSVRFEAWDVKLEQNIKFKAFAYPQEAHETRHGNAPETGWSLNLSKKPPMACTSIWLPCEIIFSFSSDFPLLLSSPVLSLTPLPCKNKTPQYFRWRWHDHRWPFNRRPSSIESDVFWDVTALNLDPLTRLPLFLKEPLNPARQHPYSGWLGVLDPWMGRSWGHDSYGMNHIARGGLQIAASKGNHYIDAQRFFPHNSCDSSQRLSTHQNILMEAKEANGTIEMCIPPLILIAPMITEWRIRDNG